MCQKYVTELNQFFLSSSKCPSKYLLLVDAFSKKSFFRFRSAHPFTAMNWCWCVVSWSFLKCGIMINVAWLHSLPFLSEVFVVVFALRMIHSLSLSPEAGLIYVMIFSCSLFAEGLCRALWETWMKSDASGFLLIWAWHSLGGKLWC